MGSKETGTAPKLGGTEGQTVEMTETARQKKLKKRRRATADVKKMGSKVI